MSVRHSVVLEMCFSEHVINVEVWNVTLEGVKLWTSDMVVNKFVVNT